MIVVTYIGLEQYDNVPVTMSEDEVRREIVPVGMKFIIARTWMEAKEKILEVMEKNRPNPGTIDVVDECAMDTCKGPG